MTVSVTDSFSNRDGHVQEAVAILSSSPQKWAIFEAVYRGKKKIKTVDEICSATGLNSKQVLNVGGPLARGGLFRQVGRTPTTYVKIDEITHIRDRIIAARNGPKRMVQPPTSTRVVTRSSSARSVDRAKRKTPSPNYDVFISHAREDKASFVKALAIQLQSAGISVWYDEFSLKWGDKLREKIDQGLAGSRYGIVVLSPNFLKKKWTKEELNGLFELEISGKTRILPIWHNLTREQVVEFSPTLAGRLALESNHPIDDLISQLQDLLLG